MSILKLYKQLYRYYGPQGWWPASSDLEMILGAILTQNTAWTNVEKAIAELKSQKLMTVRALRKASSKHIEKAIKSSGFFRQKTKRIQGFIEWLQVEYRGSLHQLFQMPKDELRQVLLQLKGFGPETVDSILLYAAKKSSFVIDAYTKRLLKRLGHISGEESYDAVQKYMIKALPEDVSLYNEYHALIVKHAKEYCRAKPLCDACHLNSTCPQLLA